MLAESFVPNAIVARPLTKRQELIWLEHELAKGAPANVMVARFDLEGALDPDRFADAFEALVAETEALRTVIDPGPSQRVRELSHRPAFVDLEGRPDAVEAFFRAHAPRPMDLSARLFDAALLGLGDRCVVYLRQHHLITDAHSHALLWKRLGELYERRPGALPRPFSEHLERERAYRLSSTHADDARFWAARLADVPPSPSFYGRAPRDRRGLIARHLVRLGAERSAALRSARGIGRHRLYATALFALLARITDQRRVTIGSPFANRSNKRLSQVVGLVMEQCPTTCEVPLGATFAELSARVTEELHAVLGHARHCTHNPGRRVFDATLNVHTVKYAPFAGLAVRGSIAPALSFASSWPDGAQGGGEALAITAFDDGEEVLAFDLNRDVFEHSERVIAHFLTMLDALLANPDRCIDDVDLLTEHERAICLAPMPKPARFTNVIDSIRAQVERTPHRPAIGSAERTLTYLELARRAGGIARALREHGVGRGDAVAIALDRSELLGAALLGTMAAGAAYVPLDLDHPAERLARIVEDAKPCALLTEPGVPLAFDLPRIDATKCGEDALAPPPLDLDDLAYVLFTSGSTGRPKGVEITHRGLASFLAAFAHTPGMDADDRVIAMATPTFDIHVVELLLPLTVGAFAFVTPARVNADGARLARIVEEERATILQATPPTWRLLIDAGWKGAPHLTALVGGEPLPPDLARALIARTGSLFNVYGPTETTVWATAQRIEVPQMPAPVGACVGHLSARVLDARQRPVPLGVEGEIYLGGHGVARGYRNRPELTAQAFVEVEGVRMYRTGDRGRFREDGALECLGRRDGQVKVRGHRVELGEIEAVLRELDGVRDAAVVVAGDHLTAHVAGATNSVALHAHASKRLPAHMVPARWQIHDALPIGPTGKIDRGALRDGIAIAAASIAPRDDTEAALAAIFAEALDLPRVGVTDDFFEMGGHSLLAAKLVERIRATLGVEVSIGAIFEARTIAALAERIHRGAAPVPGCIPLARGGGAPLFCVCGVHVYHALATRLGRPVYGVYLPVEEKVVHDARSGRTTPLDVHEMARHYVETIKARQPHGPYAIAGLSFGGLLAYEIAQQLRPAEVPVLALIDTILPRALRRDPVPWLAAQAKRFVRAPADRLRRVVDGHDETASVRERAFVAAMRRYRPREYAGEVLLFRASESSFGEGWRFPRDGGLAAFAPKLRTLDVPGSHTGVLAPPHVDVLAEKLAPFLARLG